MDGIRSRLFASVSTVQNDRMKIDPSNDYSLSGRVRSGLGQGAGFTALDWARSQFIEHCGVDPHPGTLNLELVEPAHLETWVRARRLSGIPVRPDAAGACDATLFAATVGNAHVASAVPAAVVLPNVPGYAADQIEVIASVNLREHFGVAEGEALDLRFERPHAVRAAIFDVDGTLLNSLDGYQLAASRATAAYGYEVTIEHVRHALNANQPFWDFVIPDGEPRDEQRILDLREATMRHWPDALAEVVTVLPGIATALEMLKTAGIRLAIYTGSGGESFPPLRDAGLLDLFEVIVTGPEVERRKPDPQGIEQCLDALGLAATDAVYVGDSRVDVSASLAAGVTSIAVLTGAGDAASLSAAGAHRVAAHVGKVPDLLVPVTSD